MEGKYKYVAKLLMQPDINLTDCGVRFNDGEEGEFLELLKELNDFYPPYSETDDKIIDIIEKIRLHYCHFNWEEVFELMDFNIISKRNEALFNKILMSVFYDTFIKKMDKCNNPILANYYFNIYGKVNNIEKEEIDRVYHNYLDNYLIRSGNNPTDLLNKTLVSTIKTQNGLNIENSYVTFICCLLDKVLLNAEISKKVIIYSLGLNKENGLLLKRKVLLTDNALVFENNSNELQADRVGLCLDAGYYNEAINTFESIDYSLYNKDALNTLLNTSYLDKNTLYDRLDVFLELFVYRYNSKQLYGLRKDYIYNYIYSHKIKVISCKSISMIKTMLPEEDYNSFMLHIIDNNIPVYWGEDHIYTLEYFNTKAARKLLSNDFDAYNKVRDLLQRDKYVTRTK